MPCKPHTARASTTVCSVLTIDSAGLTLGLPPRTVQLQGADVIIKLSARLEDQLLLHSSVLSKASERFAMRLRSANWGMGRKVVNEDTGDKAVVFEYRLTFTSEHAFSLTDEVWPPTGRIQDAQETDLCRSERASQP